MTADRTTGEPGSPSSGGSNARRAGALDPQAQRLVDALAAPPYLHQLGPQDGRQALIELQDDDIAGPGVDVEFRVAPVGPSGLVGFWVVRPASAEPHLPAVLYIHGGRWMVGEAGTHGRLIRDLAIGACAVMIVPEYTRTPEARFPVALEESYALLDWVCANNDALNLRPGRIAVAGDCAGATLAVGTVLLAKRRGGPRIRAQLLYCPWIDPECGSESHRLFADNPGLSRTATVWYWQQYCDEVDHDDPTVSPLTATPDDLAGLPPAFIVAAEIDVLRDEAETFAARLRAAGVEVTMARYLGVTHDFVSLRPLRTMPSTRAAIREGASFLSDALRPTARFPRA